MKKTLIILTAVILLLPLDAFAYKGNKRKQGSNNEFQQEFKSRIQDHRQQQQEKSKDFRKSMETADLDQDQRIAAIKKHRQTQYEENTTFRDQLHKERIGHLSDMLAKSKKLDDTQRQDIINRRETQYQENTAFRDKKHSENISAVDRILGDPNLSPEERKTQMKEFRAEQKKENREYRKTRREENRTFRQSFHTES